MISNDHSVSEYSTGSVITPLKKGTLVIEARGAPPTQKHWDSEIVVASSEFAGKRSEKRAEPAPPVPGWFRPVSFNAAMAGRPSRRFNTPSSCPQLLTIGRFGAPSRLAPTCAWSVRVTEPCGNRTRTALKGADALL